MKIFFFFLAIAISGCSAELPQTIERKHPAHPSHKHTASKPLLGDYYAFKPVEAGDWKALNRKVAPE